MLKITLISFALVALSAEYASADPIKCGAIPIEKVYKCLGSPDMYNVGGAHPKCSRHVNGTKCSIPTCYAEAHGWLEGSKLNKTKITSDLDQLAQKSPAWVEAVAKTKTDCLGDLSPQGIQLDCPAYDIYLCTIGTLAKYASPAQWSSEAKCQEARTYAAACPPCPEDCFAAQLPAGSCNACQGLPKSP